MPVRGKFSWREANNIITRRVSEGLHVYPSLTRLLGNGRQKNVPHTRIGYLR